MKKTLLIVTICLLQFAAFSQKSRVGIFGGLTSSNTHGKTGGVSYNAKSLTGFAFGLMVDAPLGKTKFSFQPTVQYIQKGQLYSKTIKTKDFLGLHYAELLANFVYSSNGQKGSFFVGLGPTISLPFPSIKVTKSNGNKAVTTVKFGAESPADFRAIDYGANMLIGYRFSKGYFLSAGYTFGIRNILPGKPTDILRNGSLAIKLGVLFNNK